MDSLSTQELIESLVSYDDKTGALHQRRIEGFSSSPDLKDVPCLIPSCTYHPHIKVVIDFTSTYTVDFNPQGTSISTGRRLVQKEILLDRALTLAKFWAYYFNDAAFADTSMERTLSLISDTDKRDSIKGNQQKYSSIVSDILKKMYQNNEEAANLFINNIVNMFITDVQIERSTREIGSCNVTMRDNFSQIINPDTGHRETLFFKSVSSVLNQLFSPMLPISVWARGRLYPTKWFPIFTGYIFQAAPADKEGFTTLTLTCRDALELARISTEMVNPALCVVHQLKKQDTVQLYSQPFYNESMWEIAQKMFMGGKVDNNSNATTGKQDKSSSKSDKTSTTSDALTFSELGNFKVINQNDSKFTGRYASTVIPFNEQTNIQAFLTQLRTTRFVLLWGEDITPYKTWNFASPKTFTSQFSSRYEILKLAAQRGYLDFYADGAGNIKIHPMRLSNKFFLNDAIYVNPSSVETKINKDFLGVNIITPHETLSYNKLFDIQNLATFIRIGGAPPELGPINEEIATAVDTLGSYTDQLLIEKYGFRYLEIMDETFNFNPTVKGQKGTYKFFDLAAREFLKYKNGELYTCTANIVFRPELELANPIYFTNSKEIFYIQSITHNITIGGAATTTVNCNFGRSENEIPPMLWDFIIATQKIFIAGEDKAEAVISGDNLAQFFEQELNRFKYPATEADAEGYKNIKWAGFRTVWGNPSNKK